MTNDERLFWLAIRRALLMIVGAIETRLGMERTSQIREGLKRQANCAIIESEN